MKEQGLLFPEEPSIQGKDCIVKNHNICKQCVYCVRPHNYRQDWVYCLLTKSNRTQFGIKKIKARNRSCCMFEMRKEKMTYFEIIEYAKKKGKIIN